MRESLDLKFMKMAITNAKRGEGIVSPNPFVGAVIVKDGKVVSTAYHRGYNTKHAEVIAIERAGGLAKDSTLYVTLEPCCHVGSNPPCTSAIINAGIERVVFASQDPNPLVKACNSTNLLEQKGITVTRDVLKADADYLNRVFFKYIVEQIPYVTLKIAQTIDGKIADYLGNSKWISNEFSREEVQKLREEHDAVVVGSTTVLKDDPRLTIRRRSTRINPQKNKQIIKVIIDKDLQIPLEAKLFDGSKVIIITAEENKDSAKVNSCIAKNAEVLFFKTDSGSFNFREILKVLGAKKITSILVEGGNQTAFSLLKENLVDRLLVFSAPLLSMDNNSLSGLTGHLDGRTIETFQRYKLKTIKRLGDDVFMEYLRG